MTNKVLTRFARRVLAGFPGSFPQREEAVGNPVRAEIAALPVPEQRLSGRSGEVRVLVLGGSQGARILNQAVPKALAALGRPVQIRHQCGEAMRAEAEAAYAEAGLNASVEPFIADMAEAYGWADLVVCRAGASTLAELCAAGVGSVLVPFAAAVDDHQTRNAEYLVEAGAAVLLKQAADLDQRLQQALPALLDDAGQRLAMAVAARALAKPDAASVIADIILAEADNHGSGNGQPQDPVQDYKQMQADKGSSASNGGAR